MKKVVLLILVASSLFALSYGEGEVVVELSAGSGPYQVGLTRENVPIGPYRLVVVDSSIYLLDQLNLRVLCFDTSGVLLSEISTPFRPADMAVDPLNRVWLLENRTLPAQIAILDGGEEVARSSIEYDVTRPVTAIVVHPPESLLCLSGNVVYIAVPAEGQELDYTQDGRIELAELDLDSLGALEVSGARNLGVDTDYSGRITEYLIAYGSGMLWVGVEQYIQDKSGSFSIRDIKVLSESTEPPPFISIPSSYYSYDTGWRNVAVDSQGNIYVFTSTPNGKASILRWRVAR